MAADVLVLDDHRPHIVIAEDAPAGKVHVVPLALALDWASGKKPLPEDGILRRIIVEWLACLRTGAVEPALYALERV